MIVHSAMPMAETTTPRASALTHNLSHDMLQSLTLQKTVLDDRASHQLSAALTAGGTKLKQTLRRTNLPPGDPLRRHLWQNTLTARSGKKISQEPGSLDLSSSTTHRTHMLDKQLTPGFHLTEAGENSVIRVLHCLGMDTPTLVYAPMLYPLAALLLHYMSEREALACLEVLLTENNMVIQVVEHWKQHCHAMESLSGRHAKTADRFFVQPGQETGREDLAYWALFIWKMPFEFIVRIMDCYFFEGIKVLYRAGLVIWKETYLRLLKPGASSPPPSDSLRESLQRTAANIASGFTPQSFLDRMFRVRNFSSSSIQAALATAAGVGKCAVEMQPMTSVLRQYLAFSEQHTNPSALASRTELEAIIEQVEERIAQLQCPKLIFTTDRDGTSLSRLVQTASNYRETVLLIRSMDNELFGAFCADSWGTKETLCFGRGTSFVFTLRPMVQFFRWVDQPGNQLAYMFQKVGHDSLQVGGGEHGFAISLDDKLSRGVTKASTTFQSPPLAGKPDFMVGALEILAFEDV